MNFFRNGFILSDDSPPARIGNPGIEKRRDEGETGKRERDSPGDRQKARTTVADIAEERKVALYDFRMRNEFAGSPRGREAVDEGY